MRQTILFIQGGGDGGYEADKLLAESLGAYLENQYEVEYPEIQSDEGASDYGWSRQIGEQLNNMAKDVIIVGHSFGASMILKYLSENSISKEIAGIFLIATPFWSGQEDWKQGLKLAENFADSLPDASPIFFYHAEDDEEVPIAHLLQYKQKLPQATFREIKTGGHQLDNDLSIVARDIDALQRKH